MESLGWEQSNLCTKPLWCWKGISIENISKQIRFPTYAKGWLGEAAVNVSCDSNQILLHFQQWELTNTNLLSVASTLTPFPLNQLKGTSWVDAEKRDLP